MRNILASAMAIAVALCLVAATILLGGVTPDVAAVAYALGALLTLFWVGKLFFARSVSWKQSPVHIPALCFFAYAVVRYFTSPLDHDARIEILNIGFYTLMYFLCASNFHRSRDRTILLVGLMVLVLFEAGYGFFQFWTRSNMVLFWVRPDAYRGRASGTYICPNHLAGLLEAVIALLVARLALWNPSKAAVQRIVLYKVFIGYVLLMTVGALALTLSRSSWIALVIALFSLVLWGKWQWRRLWPRLIGGALGIGIITFAIFKIEPVRNYVLLSFHEPSQSKSMELVDSTLGFRTLMWKDTMQMISDHRVFGTGPASWQWFHPQYRSKEMQAHAEFAHNDILNLASDYGLVGFTIVLVALVCFLRHAAAFLPARNSSDHRSFAVGSAVAVTALVLHSWLDFNFHIPANALLIVTLMGFTVAMEDGAARYPRAELDRPRRIALGVVLLLAVTCGGWIAGRAALAHHYSSKADLHKAHLYWDDALAWYNRAIAADPTFPVPYARIGDIYSTQSFWRKEPARQAERQQLARQAIDAYQKSLKLNPRQPEVVTYLAKAYRLAGEPDKAVQAYQRAISLCPTSADVYRELGLFYREQGDEKNALAAFEKSRDLTIHWNPVTALHLEELKSQ
jgi:O-antigen ligase